MVDHWVFWTLLAASMQAVRTAGQKQLSASLSPLATTMVRYLFGLPFALIYFLVVLAASDFALPTLNAEFLIAALFASALQIVATLLLIRLFSMRNFAVGSTYARTEVLLTAVIGLLFFGESIAVGGWIAVLLAILGLVAISLSRSSGMSGLWDRSAAYGLGAGLSFATTSLLIRKASLSFGVDNFMLTAAITLLFMVTMQTVMTVVQVAVTEPSQLVDLKRNWRACLFIGIISVVGSVGWFTAMTLTFASYVKTLGQIEFLLTLAISWYYFRERPTALEFAGMLMIVAAVVKLLGYG